MTDGPDSIGRSALTPRRTPRARWIVRGVYATVVIVLVAVIGFLLLSRHSYAYSAGFTSGQDFAHVSRPAGIRSCQRYFPAAATDFPKLKPTDEAEFLKGCYAGLKHPRK